MKVLLVCPSNHYGTSWGGGLYYPMGILLVGSLVKDTFPSWDVNIIDGELYSTKDLEKKLSGVDVLGLSANTCNYQTCLELANSAKKQGVKKVIVGGPHPSARLNMEGRPSLARIILQKQKNIDATIINDGEEAFLEYLIRFSKGKFNYSGIENIYWKDPNGNIQENPVVPPIKPPRFHNFDFSLMSFNQYWAEHKKEFPHINEKFIEGFTHIGCAWREKTGCDFCDIPYPFNKYQAPGRFWRDLREAKVRLEINTFKDYGDCLTGNSERVRAFLDSRPSDLENFEFACYGRSNEITPEMASMLKDLNVRYIYLGFDSGDDGMLRNMKDGYTVKANRESVQRLNDKGIYIQGNIIIGALGESKESVANTEALAKEIIQSPYTSQLHCSMLTPFPGAPMSRRILGKYPHLAKTDVWDTEETKKLWVKEFCEAPYEYLEAKAREINDLNPSSRKRYFGMKK